MLNNFQRFIVGLTATTFPLLAQVPEKTLIDYFIPATPVGELVSEGIWGVDKVLPRDIQNGLEDSTMKKWCYWDGQIVKGEDGKYHMYASHWDQKHHHHVGWTEESKGIYAVSDSLMGPYQDQGELWPDWKEGRGHNVVGFRMHDGRYAAITSEITRGEVFVSDKPEGPFKLLGEIKVDYNGFHPGLARYNNRSAHMANVMILPIPDNRYMLMGRNCAVMISDQGVTGPYRLMTEQAWKGLKGVPQSKMEDPTIWHSNGLYHIVVNYYGNPREVGDISYHLTSEDGIHNWKNRGVAMARENSTMFGYTDGTPNQWNIIQRPTVYVEDGEVKLFNFSVIDVHKGEDNGNDQHGSKIVIVPFDGAAFGKDMASLVKKENAIADATPAPSPWKSRDLTSPERQGNTGYDALVDTLRVKTAAADGAERFVYQKVSGDIMLTTHVLSLDIAPEMASAGVMLRQSLDAKSPEVRAMISRDHQLIQSSSQQDGGINQNSLAGIRAPYYLRLVKKGNTVTTWISQTDRYNWREVSSTQLDLSGEFYAGIIATSTEGKSCLARFKNTDLHALGTRDQIIAHDLASEIPLSGKVQVRVTYETSAPRDLTLGMQDTQSWTGLNSVKHPIEGYGEIVFEYAPTQALDPKSTYQYIISLIERGKDWRSSKDTDKMPVQKLTP